MGTLLQVSADACAAALARGDPHVVADVGDLPRELVELVALSYFKFKLQASRKKGDASNNALPLPTSSNHIPALRALAESDALSPTSLLLSDAAMTLSRGAFLYLNLASHSLVHLDINGCGWLDASGLCTRASTTAMPIAARVHRAEVRIIGGVGVSVRGRCP